MPSALDVMGWDTVSIIKTPCRPSASPPRYKGGPQGTTYTSLRRGASYRTRSAIS